MTEVLLTGATGFLGKVVLTELIRQRELRGIRHVHVLVRPHGPDSATARFSREVLAAPCWRSAATAPRDISVVAGDLERPNAGLARLELRRLQRRVTHVVHCAAAVDFGLPILDAARANVVGTLHAQEFASGCPELRSFVSTSTAYVHGAAATDAAFPAPEVLARLPASADRLLADIIAGQPFDQGYLRRAGHANTYTFTKSVAEHLLAQRHGRGQLTIVRPSIISAAQARPFRGWIDSPAAFAAFVLAIGTGKLRELVADPSTRLDLVPVDHVAARLLAAAFQHDGSEFRIEHAVAGPTHSPTIAECCDAIARHFGTPGRRSMDQVRCIDALGPGRRRGLAARLNRLFAPFMAHSSTFATSTGQCSLDPAAYLETICGGVDRHLVGADRVLGRSA